MRLEQLTLALAEHLGPYHQTDLGPLLAPVERGENADITLSPWPGITWIITLTGGLSALVPCFRVKIETETAGAEGRVTESVGVGARLVRALKKLALQSALN